MTPEAEVERWLEAAADGLPDWVREELRQHYEDAVREQQANGASPAAAHWAALRALGCADEIGGDLRELHLAERRYRLAAAASLIYPLVALTQIGLTTRGSEGVNIALYDLLLLLPLLYVLRSLNTLLALRFNRQVRRRITLIMFGAAAITVPEILMEGYWLAISRGGGELSSFGYGLLNGLMLINLVGGLVLGIGLLWLAEALISLKSGPIRLIGLLCVIDGYALMLTTLAPLAGLPGVIDLAWLISLIASTLIHMLWTLLFYRAADQPLAMAA